MAMTVTLDKRCRFAVAIAAFLGLCAGGAMADGTDAVMRANRMAYDTATKCFVADSYAGDLHAKAGQTAKAEQYQRMSRQAFDIAYSAGAKIGLADNQISRDLDFAQANELRKLVNDRQYAASVAATCKAVGLM